MFYIYLQVLVPGQRHGSCIPFGDLHSKDGPVVSYDGLDARLVMHVHEIACEVFLNSIKSKRCPKIMKLVEMS